jgi:archaellum component FlaC
MEKSSERNPERTPKKALTEVLSRELCVEVERDKTFKFVGNGRGFCIALEIAGLREECEQRLGSMGKEIASLEKRIASQKEEINTLKKEVYGLKIFTKGYFLVRDRFVSNHNRHILKH